MSTAKRPKLAKAAQASTRSASAAAAASSSSSEGTTQAKSGHAPGAADAEVQQKILDFLKQQEAEVTGREIADSTGLSLTDTLGQTQKLVGKGEVQVLTKLVDGKKKFFFTIGTELSRRVKQLPKEEQAILSRVEEAGNAGIWRQKFKSIIPNTKHLKSVLTKMIREKLIKEFKPVNNPKKPHYILYDLEPDETVSGGVFFESDEFDREFVDSLRKVILLFLQDRFKQAAKQDNPYLRFANSYITLEEISQKLRDAKITTVELRPSHCEQILTTLVADRKVVEKPTASTKAYRFLPQTRTPSALSTVPCGICPVSHNCTVGGVVNPSSCKYMDDWLQF